MRICATGATAFLIASSALAQQIDLSTLPPRDEVQLTIYNSEDLTLVREIRHVTLTKGTNELQFSWVNTLIDPSSVTLLFRDHAKELELIDTRYPHDRPQVLYWNVRSQFDGDATMEISYFTSGVTWEADYVGVTDGDERSMRFDGFVTITNESGADFEGAQVRMVVGTINLVQTIGELAEQGIVDEEAIMFGMPDERRLAIEEELRKKMAPATPMGGGTGGGGGGIFGMPGDDPPTIEKEGLSEYFIFTVSGKHSIASEWSMRLRLFEGTRVPIKTVYRYRPEEYGEESLLRVFLVRNDEASTLGSTPLPNGDVRLFRAQPTGGLSVIAFLDTKYVPIGQEFEFNLGSDPQVIWEQLSKRAWRDEFWFQRRDLPQLYSPDRGEKIEPRDSVAGWTEHELIVERIRNYRSDAIDVEFRFSIEGDVLFRSALSPKLFDFRSPEFSASVKAGETKELAYEVATREGTSAKEEHVTLEASK